jgi:hypothetical protein
VAAASHQLDFATSITTERKMRIDKFRAAAAAQRPFVYFPGYLHLR